MGGGKAREASCSFAAAAAMCDRQRRQMVAPVGRTVSELEPGAFRCHYLSLHHEWNCLMRPSATAEWSQTSWPDLREGICWIILWSLCLWTEPGETLPLRTQMGTSLAYIVPRLPLYFTPILVVSLLQPQIWLIFSPCGRVETWQASIAPRTSLP